MKTPNVIRLTITPDVARALAKAKRNLPALSDPEILKVGLSRLALHQPEDTSSIQSYAARTLNLDGYLDDAEEDIYLVGSGKPNHFDT